MNKAQEILSLVLISRHQAPEILQPGEQAFDLPTAPIPSQHTIILRLLPHTIDFVRGNQFNTLFCQRFIQRIAVIRFIADQSFRLCSDEAAFDDLFDEPDFRGASRVNVNGDWSAIAVCHCHELRTFAPLGFANGRAPFLAPTKLPSIKHSSRPKSPYSLRCRANAFSAFSNTPDFTQVENRRWHVWYGGKRSGKSCQGAPVRRIHNTPFITSRVSRAGLPRCPIRGFGNSGSINSHCSSVSSSRLAMPSPIVTLMGQILC
jgi:hypothetical protein